MTRYLPFLVVLGVLAGLGYFIAGAAGVIAGLAAGIALPFVLRALARRSISTIERSLERSESFRVRHQCDQRVEEHERSDSPDPNDVRQRIAARLVALETERGPISETIREEIDCLPRPE